MKILSPLFSVLHILWNCESLEDVVMLLQRFGFDSDSKTYRQPFLQTNFCLKLQIIVGTFGCFVASKLVINCSSLVTDPISDEVNCFPQTFLTKSPTRPASLHSHVFLGISIMLFMFNQSDLHNKIKDTTK